MESNEHILLFDGVCNLCNGLVQFIIERDKEAVFKFSPLQSSYAQNQLKQLGLSRTDYDSIVYIKNKAVLIRSTAALHILKDLKGIWRLFYIFIIIPLPIRDFFYTIIARNRYRFLGKRDVCMIPTQEIRQRFLE